MSATINQELDHEYDGIREYDNPTPGWWHLIFFLTIVFSVGYFIIFVMDPDAPTIQTAWASERDAEYKRQFAELGQLKPDEPTLLKMMGDPKWMTFADSTFQANCASCHGRSAEGSVGPNMTDDYYKNIKTIADFPRVITEGAAGGAMPAWKGRLNDNEIVLVSAYVASLRGKNLPGPRGKEGEAIAPWPAAPAGKPAPASGAPNKGS